MNERGNAYELADCVGGHPKVLGSAALRANVGRDHLVVQPTAQEAEEGEGRPKSHPACDGRTAQGSLL